MSDTSKRLKRHFAYKCAVCNSTGNVSLLAGTPDEPRMVTAQHCQDWTRSSCKRGCGFSVAALSAKCEELMNL